MPDAPTPNTPTEGTPAPATGQEPTPAQTPPAQPTQPAQTWQGEYDPERAARLVDNLRTEAQGYKTEIATLREKVAGFEQAQLSDAEKLTQRAESAETELVTARREAVMLRHGLPDEAAELMSGTTVEEINARAEKLKGLFGTRQTQEPEPLPSTLPIPGNGADPQAVSQLTREQFEAMSPPEQMAAYRAGRLKNITG